MIRRTHSVAMLGLAIWVAPTAIALAGNGNATGHASAADGAQLPSSIQAGAGATIGTDSRSSGDPTAKGSTSGDVAVSTYGEIGASHSTAIGESTYLQVDGGVNFDQKNAPDSAGSLNGRVGLGLRF